MADIWVESADGLALIDTATISRIVIDGYDNKVFLRITSQGESFAIAAIDAEYGGGIPDDATLLSVGDPVRHEFLSRSAKLRSFEDFDYGVLSYEDGVWIAASAASN
ncbi:MAG: hypothetical protein JWO29_2259 [Arthrobacter sp.]|nr:hypothetical protein [Arthrobacter sp.]